MFGSQLKPDPKTRSNKVWHTIKFILGIVESMSFDIGYIGVMEQQQQQKQEGFWYLQFSFFDILCIPLKVRTIHFVINRQEIQHRELFDCACLCNWYVNITKHYMDILWVNMTRDNTPIIKVSVSAAVECGKTCCATPTELKYWCSVLGQGLPDL